LTSSILLIVAIVTLTAVAGAVMGVVAASAGVWVRHLLPFSAGLLLGMSLFLLAPAAFAGDVTAPVLAAFATGFLVLCAVEWTLHARRSDPHATWAGVIPVATAISIHSVLDGWNLVVALSVSPTGAWAFGAGMALHKLTGGFAVGAVIRASAPNRGGAVALAAGVEATTFLGVWLFVALRSSSADGWTIWLLAATAGSLLYLGVHTLRRAFDGTPRSIATSGAASGLFTMWLISLLAH
jgi:zinc transporter ZupT